jgi:hypothetical protein
MLELAVAFLPTLAGPGSFDHYRFAFRVLVL